MAKPNKKKKQSDLGIFIIGWFASALAVGVPTACLILIKKYYPNASTDYGDKLSIIAYLFGAFFSGLFTTYRVVCKASDKDIEIDEKSEEIKRLEIALEDNKKAYRSLSPKSKIISLLLEVHQACSSLSKQDATALIMKKIREINSDKTFEPRFDGLLEHVNDSDYKRESNPANHSMAPKRAQYKSIAGHYVFYKSKNQ
ncbi:MULTISPECIES: hypothetical protein [Cronobacter]|uniref:Uncharacterized protein n=2 Tax=Cronobacter TaxID=413496 RepID=A0ABX5JTJ0_9ENTR|nr:MULTISPECIES: hypothetical protein [Cronobacter]NCH99050.1 hypothetical protein [Cronobacter malonaticus]PUW98633.1 hypothetical protein AUM46_22270 [Cronobacter malonaticus]PUX07139.1 hypothetical protein AUN13_18575 [Cronobacter malonaticus]